MDWAVWDQSYDQGFSTLSRPALTSSFSGHPWHRGLWFCHDVIEETALNEISCIEVLKLLVTKANSEVVELEEDLINLQGQLACIDDSSSEILSAALQEKIGCLDISIQSLKNTDVVDDNDFGTALLSHGEPAQTICEIVKSFYANYSNKKDEQLGNSVIKSSSVEHTETAESLTNLKKKCSTLDLSSYRRSEESECGYSMSDNCSTHTSFSEVPLRNHVEPVNNEVVLKVNLVPVKSENMDIDVAEAVEAIEGVVLKKDLISVKSECVNVSEMTKPEWTVVKDSSSGALVLATDDSVKDGFLFMIDGNNGLERRNPSSASDERSERLNSLPKPAPKGSKLRKTPKLKIEKKGPRPRKRKNLQAGLADSEPNDRDSLLEWLNHKRCANISNRSSSSFPLKPGVQRVKREHQQKQQQSEGGGAYMKIKEESVSMFHYKRQFPISSSYQAGLQISPYAADPVQNSTGLEDQSLAKCASVVGDSSSNENAELVSTTTPTSSGTENFLDLDHLLLVELRAIAKQRNMKGYSKLKKDKLAEEIRLNLMVGGEDCI